MNTVEAIVQMSHILLQLQISRDGASLPQYLPEFEMAVDPVADLLDADSNDRALAAMELYRRICGRGLPAHLDPSIKGIDGAI